MRVLATHSIRQFPLHFPSRASPCATRFRTSSTRVINFLPGLLTLDSGTDRLSRNVCKEFYYSLDNSPDECSSHKLGGGSL